MKKTLCLLLIVLCLLTLCSCSGEVKNANFEPTTSSTAEPTTSSTVEPTTSLTDEPISNYYLSYIMKYSIVENYFASCWSTEFEDGESVPYEKVFLYFFYEGIRTFDRKRLSDTVYPYYDSDTGKFAIPHKIVDEYLEQKFPTTASTEQIDKWDDELYNNETGCYECELPLYDGAGEEIEIDYNTAELRDNVFEFKATYFIPDVTPEDPVICATFVVELSRDNYKILSFKKTEEEPSGRIMALREYYCNERETDTGDEWD